MGLLRRWNRLSKRSVSLRIHRTNNYGNSIILAHWPLCPERFVGGDKELTSACCGDFPVQTQCPPPTGFSAPISQSMS
jgi:hypothetical protein